MCGALTDKLNLHEIVPKNIILNVLSGKGFCIILVEFVPSKAKALVKTYSFSLTDCILHVEMIKK